MDITADSRLPDRGPATGEGPPQRVPWDPRDVLTGVLWFIGLFIAGQVVAIPALIAFGDTSSPFYVVAFVAGAAVEVSIVVVAAGLTFRRYGGGWEQLGVRTPTWGTLGWAAAAFAGAMIISTTYGVIVQVFNIDALKTQCAEQIPKEVRDTRMLLAIASVTVIAFAPVCEELFFRGFMFPGLARGWGLVAGIIVSGLLFASAHLLYKSFIPIAGVGMVFAYAYYRSRNIFSTMAAHMAFNSLSIAAIAAGSCNDAAVIGVLHRWLAP